MKKTQSLCSLLFTLVLLCSLGAVAYAESPRELTKPPVLSLSSQEESQPAQTLSEVVEIIPESSAQEVDSAQAEAEDVQTESTSAQEKSNTPYYFGAVFAVLLFAGVAVYCKFKGNGNH